MSGTGFAKDLKHEVKQYFKECKVSEKGGIAQLVKAILMTLAFVGLFYRTFFVTGFFESVSILFLIGILLVLLGLNVMHEAAHGNLGQKKWINQIFAVWFDILGGISSQQYKFKHNYVHHYFTNIDQQDGDLDTDGALRLSPHQRHLPHHRLQAWLAIPLYSLLTLSWGPYYDFQRLMTKKVGVHNLPRYSFLEILGQIILKLVHLLLFIYLPSRIHGLLPTVLGYVFVHAVMGISLGLIFQVAHITEDEEFYPVGEKNTCWHTHQLETTANFSTENPFLCFLMGGLNFQIEHHLFPHTSYRHFPALSQIVRRVANKHGLKYRCYPSFWSAIKAHFLWLDRLGRQPVGARVTEVRS